jgi:uncharacterized protein (TIGR03067 family)
MSVQRAFFLGLVCGVLAAPSPLSAQQQKSTALKADGKQNEARALEGTWVGVSYAGDGEGNVFGDGGYIPSPDALRTGRLTLKYNAKLHLDPNEWSREEFHEGELVIQSAFTGYRVGPSCQPRTIDFFVRDVDGNEVVYRGIYELKGSTLRICRTVKPNGPRPAKFEAEKGSEKLLAVWRQERQEKAEKDAEKKEARKHSNETASAIINGDYDKAITEATKAIRLDPESVMAYLNRGLLPGVVLRLVFQRPHLLVQPGEGLPVRLKNVLLAREEEAALPRLGVHERPQHVAGQVQHFMGVGHPPGAIEQLPGVPVGEPGIHNQECHDQPDAGQHAFIEGPSHIRILGALDGARFLAPASPLTGPEEGLRADAPSAVSSGPILLRE